MLAEDQSSSHSFNNKLYYNKPRIYLTRPRQSEGQQNSKADLPVKMPPVKKDVQLKLSVQAIQSYLV